ncbi:MAG: hypothetical protein ACLFMT_06710 [Halobacteriales archaeon]
MSKITHGQEKADDGFFDRMTWKKAIVLFGVLMMVLWPIAMVAQIV